MEKTINIRFINRPGPEYKDSDAQYAIQRRTWYSSWKYIGYTINMGYGSVYNYYVGKTKQEVLNKVLESYYKIDKRFVNVIEHSGLKLY